MESKKKKLIIGVVVIICIIVVALGGFAGYTYYTTNIAPQEVVEQETLEVTDEPLYEIDGYSDYDTWMADLTAKKDAYVGFADEKIADLEGYLTEDEQNKLREYEADMAAAETILECGDIEILINQIIDPAYEKKNADIAAEEAAAQAAQTTTYTEPVYNNYSYNNSYSGSGNDFKSQGVIYQNGTRYTYYSSNVAYHYRTPEWTAGSDGLYRTSEGYIVVASGDHAQGSLVDTPFGTGQVLDSCATSGTIDIYTNF